MHGTERVKPIITEGKTKRAAWVMIMPMKPTFVRPYSRITPISNVLVSTDIRSRE